MNPNTRPLPVPPSWRDAAHHLRLAQASEAQARACASVQDVTGTVRALLSASRAARRAATRLGQAAATVDGSVGRVPSTTREDTR